MELWMLLPFALTVAAIPDAARGLRRLYKRYPEETVTTIWITSEILIRIVPLTLVAMLLSWLMNGSVNPLHGVTDLMQSLAHPQ